MEAGFVLLVAALALMAFFTVLTIWLVPKVLETEGHEDEESEHADGELAHA